MKIWKQFAGHSAGWSDKQKTDSWIIESHIFSSPITLFDFLKIKKVKLFMKNENFNIDRTKFTSFFLRFMTDCLSLCWLNMFTLDLSNANQFKREIVGDISLCNSHLIILGYLQISNIILISNIFINDIEGIVIMTKMDVDNFIFYKHLFHVQSRNKRAE